MIVAESGVILAVGAGVVLLAVCMVVHLVGRAFGRPRDQQQAEFDALVLTNLQSGTISDVFLRQLRSVPRDVARRGLIHALKALGEQYLATVQQLYDQLGFAPHALRALNSYRWMRRAEAALELGALRRVEAAPVCLHMLRDRRPEARIAAAWALSDMGATHALRSILESIPVCSRWAISDVVEVVRGLGEAAVPELHAIIATSTVRQARLAAIEALGELAHGDSFPVVEALQGDRDLEMRVYVTRALGRIGGDGVMAALGRALKDPAWEVRAVAARSLGAYREADALALLQGALADPSWWVRLNAAESMANQETEGADALRQSLQSGDSFARAMATQMLQTLQLRGGA